RAFQRPPPVETRISRAGRPRHYAGGRSSETNFADAVLEVFRPADNFNLDPHEKNRQIAPVEFWKAHGVFLRGDNHFGLALFAAVDRVEDFLLRETMVIGEAFGVNQFA